MSNFHLGGNSKSAFKLSLLTVMMLQAHYAFADEATTPTAVMPTIKIEAMSELDPIKSYIDYEQASVTRNGLKKKDIPQTINTIDVQKYKIYGANDLSVMLQGTPGVSTSYDMRGDGINLRGFNADTGDIYRDGIRESGQVRRSTANIERIEILKGPASVLYGRSSGGGVINMVSKFANFDSKSSVGVYAGSYDNYGTTVDFNQVLNDNVAVRLTGEYGESNSFRSGIDNKIEMFSPSFTYKNDEGLTWTMQYTYDKLHRVPDRGPSYTSLPKGTSIKTGFAQEGDFVNDVLQVARSDLNYEFAPNWNFHWALSYRQAEQNFDHFYAGGLCTTENTTISNAGSCKGHVGDISQIYYWQKTDNKTTSNTFDIRGEFDTGSIKHNLLVGADWTYEQREPLLANKNEDGTAIYGYVNPLTGQRSSSRGSGHLKLNTHNYNQGEGYGVFIQDLISFNDYFKVMLGGRYDYFHSQTTNHLKPTDDKDYHRSIDGESFSPNIGLIWQPVESQSFYASYSKSFAPFGGRVGVSVVSADTKVSAFDAEPQYNEQYEVGVKSDWLNDRLSTQFSIYDIRKNNIRYKPDPENKPEEWVVGGQHQSKGIEFSFIGRALDNLFVRGGYSYMDTEVTKDNKPANIGKELNNTPRHTGNVFVRYLPTDKIYGEIGATYVGDAKVYPNGNLDREPNDFAGFTRLDAAIGYSANPWNITLAVNNLTNKEYWRSESMPGTPRNFLVRLNYQF
ncbi:TonB-dependent receptor [Acinetobacter courvalinii]|uniref:TonB-dependent receptor n=1 Tax=Acinetobacter courvalinii TaxID=280147 RepID=UPI0018FFA8F5|nr:TonB-dependent siderophore receptor [Acinetobacter courvalinii]MBJ8416903.1 TonB-dependent siderophore receptor [Acinetobacter courvalinii]